MENWCFFKSSSLLKGMNILINSFWFLWCYRKDHLHPSPFQLLMSQQPPLPEEAHHRGESCERFHLHPLPRDLLDKMHQLIERTYKTLVSCLDAVKWTQLSSFFWSKTSFLLLLQRGAPAFPPGSSQQVGCQQHRQLEHASNAFGGGWVPWDLWDWRAVVPESSLPIKDSFHHPKE